MDVLVRSANDQGEFFRLDPGHLRRKVDWVLLEASEGFTTGNVALQLPRKQSAPRMSSRTHVQPLT
jgi:hypothetical protein